MGNLMEAPDEEEHDCLDNFDTATHRCTVCGDSVEMEDCLICNRPAIYCGCDEAYERAKDERMGL